MCDTDPRPRTETPQMNAKDARLLNVTELIKQTLIPIGNVISVVEYLPKPVTPDTQPDPDPVADPE